MSTFIEFCVIVITICAIICAGAVLDIRNGMKIMFEEIVEKAEIAINNAKEQMK